MSSNSVSEWYGGTLAQLLTHKITPIYPQFNGEAFIKTIIIETDNKMYSARLQIFAEQLKRFLPSDYPEALKIIVNILGEENPNQTGTVSEYYWVLPLAKFVELYGLNHFELSMNAIAEITKRSTGEFAIRPYIRQYPKETLLVLNQWVKADNFHLRRLASEGLRPKLPWATKLDTFINNPYPIFSLLSALKADEILYVKKSVANHLADWIKVNPEAVKPLLKEWQKSSNKNTQWIVKYALRNHSGFLA